MIVVIADKDPYGLNHYSDVVERVDCDDAEKRLIVDSADAVIQKLAVMVKVISTAITSRTVVTVYVHIPVTDNAEIYLINTVSIR